MLRADPAKVLFWKPSWYAAIKQYFQQEKKYWMGVFFIFLFISIVLTRGFQNVERMQWFDDVARDTTIARLVAQTPEYDQIRPRSAGLESLQNTTLYFNFLGSLYSFAGSDQVFWFQYGILNGVITVFSLFGIGYVLYGWKGGVALSLLGVIHFRINFMNISVYQRYLSAALTPLFIWSVLVAVKKRSSLWLTLSAVFYSIYVYMHNSAFTVLIPYLFAIVFVFWKDKSIQKKLFFAVVVLICLGVYFLTSNVNPLQVLRELRQPSQAYCEFCDPIHVNIDKFFSYTLLGDSTRYGFFFFLPFLILEIIKKKRIEEWFFVAFLLSYFLFQIITVLLNSVYLQGWPYYVHYTPLFIGVPVLATFVRSQQHEHLWKYIQVIIFSCIGVVYSYFFLQILVANKEWFDFNEVKNIVQIISVDIQRRGVSQYALVDYTPIYSTPDWFSPAYNYFLFEPEEIYGLSEYDNNLWRSHSKVDTVYLICRDWAIDENSTLYNKCVVPFMEKYSDYYLIQDASKYELVEYLRGEPWVTEIYIIE